MHFNSTHKSTILGNAQTGKYTKTELFAVDAVNIDDHSRFTFTKRLKKVFPVQSGDTIAVYQNEQNDKIILNVQRSGSIVGSWICKRREYFYNEDHYHVLEKIDKNNHVPKKNDYEKYDKQQGYPKHTQRPDNSTLQQEHIPNIMIVDDEEDILLLFKTFLKDNDSLINVNAETFKSPQQALLRFIESYYDLVIIDVRLPGINGIQLCRIMRSIRPDIKVLFISALDSAEEFVTMLPGIGASDIIKKPMEMEHFIDRVKNILNK
jgi:CheY-like chemotaxis protein